MQTGADVITIDGSFGEGGGQILRTALLLSIATNKPFEIHDIRAGRPKPGLLNQHLSVVRAFREITSSKVEGDELGSTKLRFFPGKLVNDKARIDVGTAGSITLILATLLPAMSIIGENVTVNVKGGTDTKWSPTYDYFSNVIIPFYSRLGINVSSRLIRRGFYPVGQGEVSAESYPARNIASMVSVKGSAKEARGVSVCSNLPITVAERQAKSAKNNLEKHGINAKIDIKQEPASSAGTVITIWHVNSDDAIFVGGDAVGERGVRAEDIGKRAADSFINSSNAPLDIHIADIAIPLLSLAKGNSEIAFPEVTGHIRSNIYVSELFTKRRFLLSKLGRLEKLQIL